MLRTIEEAKRCICPKISEFKVIPERLPNLTPGNINCKADKCMAFDILYVCDKCGRYHNNKNDIGEKCGESLLVSCMRVASASYDKNCDGEVVQVGYCKLIFKGEEVE